MSLPLKSRLFSPGALIRKVAERRRAETDLRQSEQRFRLLTKLSPDAIWVNRGDRIELVNSQALRLLGAERASQVEGLTPWEIFHPDSHDTVRERLRNAREGRIVQQSEEVVVRLDGSTRAVEVSSARFVDAQGPAVQIVLRDVTERHRRDQELRKLNRALTARSKSTKALLRSEGMEEIDYLREICTIVNQDCGHAMVWIGFKEDDPERSIRPVVHAGFEEGYMDALRLTWDDTERGRGPGGSAIRTGRTCGCQDIWTDPAFAPWRSEAIKRGYRSSLALPLLSGGQAFGAISLYSHEANAFSPSEVALLEELATDLAYGIIANRLRRKHALAEEAVREASRRKDEFLGTLAHELRNPLAPIRTGAYLLGLRPAPDPETGQIYAMIARQSAHMARLVDDLLQVSRIEQGKLELRRERVELDWLLAQALEVCKPALEARSHRLALTLSDPAPVLEADPIRLEQMVVNLVNNACKCTPPGGNIQVWARLEGADAVLGVRDDGVGIAPEDLGRIFDLFYQAGGPWGTGEGGLGIGLTLVQRLARLHGGSVTAASAGPGQGSEFVLRLPALASPPAQPGPAPDRPAGSTGRRRHVLIVDDDANVRTTTEMLLKALDYQVTAAADGRRGIERALALRPDIALIDLGMPGMDGCEVAARIRAELGSAIHLVALTGYSRDMDLDRTRAAGFDLHLVKSGDPRELLQLLSGLP